MIWLLTLGVLCLLFAAEEFVRTGPAAAEIVRHPAELVDALLAGDWPLFVDAFQHLLMPALIMSLALLGTVIRIVRSQMLEEQGSDYARTARAKGMTRGQVLNRHVLRNAITPVITIVGVSVGLLIMGAVLIETIFSWNGIGTYAVESSRALDFPAITGVCLVPSAA